MQTNQDNQTPTPEENEALEKTSVTLSCLLGVTWFPVALVSFVKGFWAGISQNIEFANTTDTTFAMLTFWFLPIFILICLIVALVLRRRKQYAISILLQFLLIGYALLLFALA